MKPHQEYQRIQVSALGESLGIIHPGLMLIIPSAHGQCPISYTHTSYQMTKFMQTILM